MSIAIITGASSGMGAEFIKQLKLQYGVNDFWLVARREDRLLAFGEELGIKYKVIAADLCTNEGINLLKTALEKQVAELTTKSETMSAALTEAEKKTAAEALARETADKSVEELTAAQAELEAENALLREQLAQAQQDQAAAEAERDQLKSDIEKALSATPAPLPEVQPTLAPDA